MEPIDRVPLPPDPNTRKPKFRPPAGTCDTHFHVFGPPHLVPFSADRPYTPPSAPIDHYLGMAKVIGVERAVLAQPIVHGFDNAQVFYTLARGEGRLRAVVRNNPDLPDLELRKLNDAGVRGIRFTFTERLHGAFDESQLATLMRKVERFNWILDFHIDPPDIVRHAELLRRLPLQVIIDHCGSVVTPKGIHEAGLRALLDLAGEKHIFVKIAAHDRALARGARYEDVVSVAQALVRRCPDRLIWGTDWPHPYVYRHGEMPNDGDLMNMMLDFASDEAVRHAILADNPARLFGFT
jgi:predicted TIM-barrel fold metal-dependent hydrolase